MKKKIGKTIGDAKERLEETRAAYRRAALAYFHWLEKERRYIEASDFVKFELSKIKTRRSRK